MSKSFTTGRFPQQSGGVVEHRTAEDGSRWRADRDERLRRAASDAKRIERAERHSARLDGETDWHVGSTVRAVA